MIVVLLVQKNFGNHSTYFNAILIALNLDSLEFRRKREDLILLYKINNTRLRNSVLSFRARPGMRGHDFVLSKERTCVASRRHF